MIDPMTFKAGMRRLASGVSVITTIADGVPHGFAATAVTSVAADPPTLLVCVNRGVSCHDVLLQGGVFCVNLLADGDADVAQRFSRAETRHQRFTESEWVPLATGSPALSAALVSFDCTVVKTLAVHSHTIFVAEVTDMALSDCAVSPLLYANGRFDALRSDLMPA